MRKNNSPRVIGTCCDTLRVIGCGIKGIKNEDAVVAIDNQHLGLPMLTLQSLPPDHHVRMAIGGRPCFGVFARQDIAQQAVLGVYVGKSCYEAGNITWELNHHTGSPNVQFVQVVNMQTGLKNVLVVALADIREGEEATIDYFPNLVVSRIDACMQQAAWW